MMNTSNPLRIAWVLLFIVGPCLGQTGTCKHTAIFINAFDAKTEQPVEELSAAHLRMRIGSSATAAVTTVERARPPKHAMIVLDASGSMADGPRWTRAKRAAAELLLAPPADTQVSFVAFTGGERWLNVGVNNRIEFAERVRTFGGPKWPSGRTPLHDALHEAERLVGGGEPGDVIFVVTDGGENASKMSETVLRGNCWPPGFAYLG